MIDENLTKHQRCVWRVTYEILANYTATVIRGEIFEKETVPHLRLSEQECTEILGRERNLHWHMVFSPTLR